MSIATAIQKLQAAKADIKAAIEEKGVTVLSTDKITNIDSNGYSDYGNRIREIEQGSGSGYIEVSRYESDNDSGYTISATASEITVANEWQLTPYEISTLIITPSFPSLTLTTSTTSEHVVFVMCAHLYTSTDSTLNVIQVITATRSGSSITYRDRTGAFASTLLYDNRRSFTLSKLNESQYNNIVCNGISLCAHIQKESVELT